jgi:hypothetical protein
MQFWNFQVQEMEAGIEPAIFADITPKAGCVTTLTATVTA